jgi:hypothetical protein
MPVEIGEGVVQQERNDGFALKMTYSSVPIT